MLRVCQRLLVLLSCGSSLIAQGGANGEVLVGRAETVDGRTLRGPLTLAPDGTVTVGAEKLMFDQLLWFERADAATIAKAAPHRVWLRSGLELPCTRLGGRSASDGKPARLTITLPSSLEVDVPLGMVRALRHGGSARPEPALFASDLQNPAPNQDVLFVQKDGKAQRSLVTVTGLQTDRVDFTLRETAYEFAFAGIAAIVFGANTGFPPDRQPRPRTTVELKSGERLEGRLLAVDTHLHLRLDEGAVLDVPHDKLLRFQVASDRLVWLSDLEPKVDQTPAFDRIWPWNKDRSPAGPGLVVGRRSFSRGIGMVPRTRLTYDLGGNYDFFEAWIGIDDRGGPQAHAIFRVRIDGELAFESAPKTLGLPAEAVRVELRKCRQLTIEVDFGKNYDLGDFCVFADARVVQR